MRKSISKQMIFKIVGILSFLTAAMWVDMSYAADVTTGITLESMNTTLGGSVTSLSKILSNLALVAGVFFILAALFKAHQHFKNPTQIQASQFIVLLIIGGGLMIFPFMIPTAKTAVFGSAATSNIKASGISKLVRGS